MNCAHCGQPVDLSNGAMLAEANFYHGDCYRLEFPPEHPEEWPKPIQSESGDWRDGTDWALR